MEKYERFQEAYEYLKSHGAFHSKTELAELLGRTRAHVSGAYHGKEPFFNDSFLRSFCQKFPEINIDFLLHGEGEMVNTPKASEPMGDYVALPTWADALIQMVTEQVKANEDMRRELRQSLEEVASLKQELQNAINNLKS